MIFVLTALLLSSFANAEEIKIFESVNYRYQDARTNFEINKDLGRAWVNLGLEDRSFDEISYDRHRIQVEGLSFDRETNMVLLERDGQIIECGKLQKLRWTPFKIMEVKPTGRCKFVVKHVKLSVDDGFEIKKLPFIQVFLSVN